MDDRFDALCAVVGALDATTRDDGDGPSKGSSPTAAAFREGPAERTMDDRFDALRAVVGALGATSGATSASACGGVSTSRKDGACGGVSTSRKDGACGARAGLSKTGVAVVAFPPSPLTLLLPLYPHRSRTTSGSAFRTIESALADKAIVTARIEGYATASGYIEALCDRITEAAGQLPESERATAPVLFSAHGLPEAYIRRGDPYLDEVRSTVGAVTRRLALEGRSQLAFQSRVGRRRWLAPTTEAALDALGAAGHRAVVVVPVSFTGEHLETLQEIDILYRERAAARGITSFVRARAVGCHPAFISGLAGLVVSAAREHGWI